MMLKSALVALCLAIPVPATAGPFEDGLAAYQAKDYASFLKSNPRYAQVINSSRDVNGFAQGMQRAGYATDPHYAKKLISIMHKMV